MKYTRYFWLLWLGLATFGYWKFGIEGMVWWSLGLGAGPFIRVVDQFIYVYWLKPHEQLSVYVQHQVKNRDYRGSVRTLWARAEEQQRLITQSVLFLLIWPVMTVYVMTSTASLLALGLLFGLGMMTVLLMAQQLLTPREFQLRWLWQVKREFTQAEIKWLFFIWSGMMVGLLAILGLG